MDPNRFESEVIILQKYFIGLASIALTLQAAVVRDAVPITAKL